MVFLLLSSFAARGNLGGDSGEKEHTFDVLKSNDNRESELEETDEVPMTGEPPTNEEVLQDEPRDEASREQFQDHTKK